MRPFLSFLRRNRTNRILPGLIPRVSLYFTIALILALLMSFLFEYFGIPGLHYSGEIEGAKNRVFKKLAIVADFKKDRLLRLIDERMGDIKIQDSSPTIQQYISRMERKLRLTGGFQGADEVRRAAKGDEGYARVIETFKVMAGFYNVYQNIQLADIASGRIIASLQERDLGKDVREETFFSSPIRSRETFINIVKNRETGSFDLVISYLLKTEKEADRKGPGAILIAKLTVAAAFEPLLDASEGLGNTGEVVLLNREGVLLTSSKPGMKGKVSVSKLLEPFSQAVPLRLGLAGREGMIEARDYRDVDVLAAYRFIQLSSGYGFGMVVKEDRNEALGYIYHNMLATASTCLLAVIFALSIFLVFVRKLSRRVEALGNTIERMDFRDIKRDDRAGDELSALEDNLNIMLGKIEEKQRSLESEVVERKKMEKLARESGERFKSAFEAAPIGMAIVSTFGQWLQVNEELCRMTGYSREELLEKTFQDITYMEDLDHDITLARKLITGDLKSYSIIKRYIHKSGSLIYARVSMSLPRDQNGNPLHFIAQIEDITEKERLESEVLRMQRIESLGVLAGGITHDFNNMLSKIISYMSLAKLEGKAVPGVQSHLSMAEKAVMSARDLTRQLLTFSRGGTPVKKAVFTAKFIQDTVDFIMHGSSCTCTVSIADDLSDVEIDESQMSQVINNIFLNAMQEMPKNGTIRVTAVNERVSGHSPLPLPPGNYVKISIADSGKGIAPEVLGKIFDPFFTTKRKGGGLGLSVSYSIMKKHKGSLGVESELGKGATFHIYLPAAEKNAVTANAAADFSPGGRRILVMDDDKLFLQVLATMLMKLGYVVETSIEGEEAVRKYARALELNKRFDAVILDLTVPSGRGGEYVMKELLKIDPKVKALVSSAYSNSQVIAYYNDYGFKGVMAKPYGMETLDRVLGKVISGESARE